MFFEQDTRKEKPSFETTNYIRKTVPLNISFYLAKNFIADFIDGNGFKLNLTKGFHIFIKEDWTERDVAEALKEIILPLEAVQYNNDPSYRDVHTGYDPQNQKWFKNIDSISMEEISAAEGVVIGPFLIKFSERTETISNLNKDLSDFRDSLW